MSNSRLLAEMIETVDRLKRDYPDVPVRFEIAPDVWEVLRARIPRVLRDGFTTYPGIPVCVRTDLEAGEWAPVFRGRRASFPVNGVQKEGY